VRRQFIEAAFHRSSNSSNGLFIKYTNSSNFQNCKQNFSRPSRSKVINDLVRLSKCHLDKMSRSQNVIYIKHDELKLLLSWTIFLTLHSPEMPQCWIVFKLKWRSFEMLFIQNAFRRNAVESKCRVVSLPVSHSSNSSQQLRFDLLSRMYQRFLLPKNLLDFTGHNSTCQRVGPGLPDGKAAGLPNQGILKGEVSLYCWPPVWLDWNQL